VEAHWDQARPAHHTLDLGIGCLLRVIPVVVEYKTAFALLHRPPAKKGKWMGSIDRSIGWMNACIQIVQYFPIMQRDRSKKRRAGFAGHKTSQQRSATSGTYPFSPNNQCHFFFANPFRHDKWKKCVLFIWGLLPSLLAPGRCCFWHGEKFVA
jgi:hypothetical protein